MESAEVKHWYRDFAMRDLWQRLSVRLTAVSYTHLDVYKRQSFSFAGVNSIAAFARNIL